MKNVVAVLLAVIALWGALWGFGAPARVSVGVASVALLAASVLLLVDVEELM